MYAQAEMLDEDLSYDVDARHRAQHVSERRTLAVSRQLTNHERRNQQSRFSRRSTPTRMAGSHRRRSKQYGL